MSNADVHLMAHLMRRAGFGATRDELESAITDGYENTVDALLDTSTVSYMPDDIISGTTLTSPSCVSWRSRSPTGCTA